MVEMVAVLTVKGTGSDQAPFCCTRAVPEVELEATVATTCVSLQLTGVPRVLPSHTAPVPCAAPNPDPEMAGCTPAAPDVGDTPVTMGGPGYLSGREDLSPGLRFVVSTYIDLFSVRTP